VSNCMFTSILHGSVVSTQGRQWDNSPAMLLELREIRLPPKDQTLRMMLMNQRRNTRNRFQEQMYS
jgi:hypothetical protein